MGRESPVNWLSRSPDLTSPEFCLWGYLKTQVYNDVSTTRDNMMQRIMDACSRISPDVLQRTVRSCEEKINKYIEVQGHHFEHLLELTNFETNLEE